MTSVERATVAVFGVLLAWMVMAVGVGTDDKGQTGTSTEKIEIIRVFPVLTDTQDRFMLIGRDEHLSQRPSDPEIGEQVKALKSHPVPIVPIETPDRFMLIGRM